MKTAVKISLCSLLILFSVACATDGKIHRPEAEADPFESFNRSVFEFNQQFDKYIMKPLAKGYRAITTQSIRDRVRDILSNLREPLSAANHLLQADPKASAASLSRFVLNSTLGLAGAFDVAEGWGLKKDTTGFNETFAKWCIKDGPYIVLPFLGPSTPRAATGLAFEFIFDPVFWATYHDANIKDKVAYSYAAIQAISIREAAMTLTDDLERNSVDLYAATRSAYLQYQSKLRCFNDVSGDTAVYDFDFGIEDDVFEEMEDE